MINNKIMQAVYVANGREFPFFDCYGVVKYLYKEEHNIDIIDFEYIDPADPKNEKFFFESLDNPRWTEVKPKKGVIIALKTAGHINHCGYMISPTKFLHIMGKPGVIVGDIEALNWKHRIVGFYSYD